MSLPASVFQCKHAILSPGIERLRRYLDLDDIVRLFEGMKSSLYQMEREGKGRYRCEVLVAVITAAID